MRSHRRFTVRTHSVLKILIASFVVLYALVAYEGGRKSPRGEYFPVFNWSLFSGVPSMVGVAELHVKRIGDQTFDAPINYPKLGSYFSAARSIAVGKNVMRMYRAQQSGDSALAEQLRMLIESQYLLGHGAVEYQIVYVEYNPIDRWNTGRNLREQVIGEWQTGDGT